MNDTKPEGRRAALPTGLIVALVVLAFGFGGTAVWLGSRLTSQEEELPVLGQLPAFSLVSHEEVPVGLETWRGSVWVADFIFTRCGGICPAMTARMSRLRQELPEEVRFVSFTVDPAYDTPEVLSNYSNNLDPGERWTFVAGPKDELYTLANDGFHLVAMEVPLGQQHDNPDGPFLHSPRFVLVDREGRIRGYYDSRETEDMQRLVQDALAIL
jgi:protein SCO1/2